MQFTLTLALENDLAELERTSGVLDEFGKRHRIPPVALFDLHLALDEILTNVVSYGYDDDGDHEIIVRLMIVAEHPPTGRRGG